MTAWVSTQGVIQTAQQFAEALKIPQPNVHCINKAVPAGDAGKLVGALLG